MLEKYFADPQHFIDFGHAKTKEFPSQDFHLHDRFEIYFFKSGDVNYFIEKKVYKLKFGDLLIMNSNEIHKPSFFSEKTYERVVIHFDPNISRLFSASGQNILKPFTDRPLGEQNKLSLDKYQIEKIQIFFEQLDIYKKNESKDDPVLKLCTFIELLIFIKNIFEDEKSRFEHPGISPKLMPVLEYIDNNLTNDLSLSKLSELFYINRSYLCRLFKKSTGSPLHEYIIVKRISKAKNLLSKDASATEAAYKSGFNDYSSFYRIFKRIVGTSPKKYKHSIL